MIIILNINNDNNNAVIGIFSIEMHIVHIIAEKII